MRPCRRKGRKSPMTIHLLCEYMLSPTGIDTGTPLFSWYTDDPCFSPSAARVSLRQAGCDALLYDTGFVPHTGSHLYAGPALKSGRTYLWQVTLLCGEQQYPSQPASFTMGLLPDTPWQARWVGGIRIDAKCYMYRHEWLAKKPVRSAALFVASPNYNEVTVNGIKPDDSLLNNTFADYDKSLYYVTYDLTPFVRQGKNAIGIMTGLGWRSLREAEDGVGWGDSLFAMQLLLEYADGSEECLPSHPDAWRFTTDTPVTYNSIYNGETYDARLEMPGWDKPGFDESAWHDTVEKEPPEGVLRSQLMEPIRMVGEMPIQSILPAPDGDWTLDFGKNFAGWVRIRMQGERGQKITIRPAEMVYEDGRVNPTSLRRARPVDTYIFKGEGVEEWQPRFTYHGFRYAQVSGLKDKPAPGMFTGCIVRSGVERTGRFASSHPIVQGFYDMVCQTEESNLHGVPTDCPQRDERLGWLNDMTVRNEGALYGFRLYQLYAKWLRDIRDTQGKVTGAITDTAPFLRYGFRPADPVSGSFLLLPWHLYLHYGDVRILRENYEANGRWVRYLMNNRREGVVRFSSMGDWAAPVAGTDHTSTGGGALSTITPPLLMSTGFLYYDLTLMAKMARVLGLPEDETQWLSAAENVKEDFNRAFFCREKGCYGTGSQASNILPLYFGLVEKEHVPTVVEHLCRDILLNGGHLTTGNICSRFGIEVLFLNGRQDLAWHLLSQTEYPSWGFMLQNGATTVWERWEKLGDNDFMAEMAAMNHPMNGSAVVSLYKYLAGILPDETRPGWQNILFRPSFPSNAPDASACLHTIRGPVESSWKREGDHIHWHVTVPAGCTGTVYLPGRETPLQVPSGTHRFTLPAT